MTALVLVLTILGGLLPVVAVAWTYQRSRAEAARQQSMVDRYWQLMEAGQSGTDAAKAAGVPTGRLGDLLIQEHLMRLAITRSNLDIVRLPGVVGLVGIACGTAAAGISLYL